MIQITTADKRRHIDHGLFIIDLVPLGTGLANHSGHGIYQLGRIRPCDVASGRFGGYASAPG